MAIAPRESTLFDFDDDGSGLVSSSNSGNTYYADPNNNDDVINRYKNILGLNMTASDSLNGIQPPLYQSVGKPAQGVLLPQGLQEPVLKRALLTSGIAGVDGLAQAAGHELTAAEFETLSGADVYV